MDIRKTNSLTVPHEQLRWCCNLKKADFSSTDDLEACDEILGQERALKALKLGLNMEYLSYNIFITGKSGTGRNATIKMSLKNIKRTSIIFDDKCKRTNRISGSADSAFKYTKPYAERRCGRGN